MPSSPPRRLEDSSLVQRDWLAYIGFRLYLFGEIGRLDLTERFGVASVETTYDSALYREIVLHNITSDGNNKVYRIGQEFSPLFEHTSLRILLALSLDFGDGVNDSMQTLLSCKPPIALNIPKMGVLATIYQGIHARRPVAIRYRSMSNDESERAIVPFASVGIGLCWHIRAFDRKSREFRDFVVTHIEEPTLPDKEPQADERSHNDIQWTRIVELDFVSYPSVE